MKIVSYTVKKFGDHRERRSYAKTKNAIELGNLLEVQKKSYEWFITDGIKEVFDDIFPVESFTGNLALEFGEYTFEKPRYTIKECKERYVGCHSECDDYKEYRLLIEKAINNRIEESKNAAIDIERGQRIRKKKKIKTFER